MSEAVKKNGVNFGILLGGFLVVLTVAMYAIDLELFTNSWLGFLRLIATIIVSVAAVLKAKSAMQGIISFKESFTAFFITSAIGSIFYTLTIILLFNVIDTSAKETVSQLFLEATVKALKMFSSDSKLIAEAIRQQKETDSLGAGSQLLGLAISIIGYSIVGLIVALITKTKPRTDY